MIDQLMMKQVWADYQRLWRGVPVYCQVYLLVYRVSVDQYFWPTEVQGGRPLNFVERDFLEPRMVPHDYLCENLRCMELV